MRDFAFISRTKMLNTQLASIQTRRSSSPIGMEVDPNPPSVIALPDHSTSSATHIVPDDLGGNSADAAFAQRPSDILATAGDDTRGATAALARQGELAGLAPEHRYFTLLGRLRAGEADLATAALALDILLRLPVAVQRLASGASAYVAPPAQLARLTDSIGVTAAHRALAETVHAAVENYLADSSASTEKVLKRYLANPGMQDRVLVALCEAAALKGAPLSDDQQCDLNDASNGTQAHNLAFRAKLTRQLHDYLDVGAETDWQGLLQEAHAIAQLESAQRDAHINAELEAERNRPPFFGLQVAEKPDANGRLQGPTNALVACLPSHEDVAALAHAVAPELADPLLHMAPLDLRPLRTTVLCPQHPEHPERLLPVVELSFHDPASTPVENALRFDTAARLLRPGPGELPEELHPRFDEAAGTIYLPVSAYGSSNDVAVRLRGRDDAHWFLDQCFLGCGTNHNGADYFMPAQSQSKFIDQGDDPEPGKVVELSHLAATVYRHRGDEPHMQFALRLQLAGSAGPQDTQELQHLLANLISPSRIARNGSYSTSIAVAIGPALAEGAGTFVDPQGRPAFRCVANATDRHIEQFLQLTGLAGHFEPRWDEASQRWTAVTVGVPAAPASHSFSIMERRDHVPMRLRDELPTALAYAASEEAAAAVQSDPALADMLERYRAALAAIEAALAQDADFGTVHAAVQPLVELRQDIEQRMAVLDAESAQYRHLATLFSHSFMAVPVQERAELLAAR